LRITEEEITAVSKNDIIGMYFEPETNSVVFKEVEPQDALQASNIIRERNSNNSNEYEN